MKTSTILAAAALIASTGAFAADPEPQAGSETQQPEKKICRTDRATGSLTRRTRICMTRAQWDDLHSRTNKGVSEMQGQGSGGQTVQNNAGAGG